MQRASHDIANPANYQPHTKNAFDLLSEILDEAKDRAERPNPADLSALIDRCAVPPTAEYKQPDVVLSLNGAPILSRGQFSNIIGLSGSRKSWFCYGIASVILSGRPGGYFSTPLTNPKVVYIDTEMGDNLAARALQTIKRLTGQESPNIQIYSLREQTPLIRWYATAAVIEQERPDFVIIDGIADLCISPNDERDSFAVQQFLMTFSKRYNCHIMNVIHLAKSNAESKGTGGGRGHLGSNLNRKAEIEFFLAKDATDKNYTNISMPKDSRLSAPQEDFSMFVNKDTLPEFCACVAVKNTPRRDSINETIVKALTDAAACGKSSLTRVEIANRLCDQIGGKPETRKKDVDAAARAGIICKISNGSYAIVQ